jgi:hypothetical protein
MKKTRQQLEKMDALVGWYWSVIIFIAFIIAVAFVCGQTGCTNEISGPTPDPALSPVPVATATATNTPPVATLRATPTRLGSLATPEVSPLPVTPRPGLALRVVASPCLRERSTFDNGQYTGVCYPTNSVLPVYYPPFAQDIRGVEVGGGWCWIDKLHDRYVACSYLASPPAGGSLN